MHGFNNEVSICTRNPGEPEALLQTTLNAQYQTVWKLSDLTLVKNLLRQCSHTNQISFFFFLVFFFFFWPLVIVFREICSFCLNIELSGTSLWVLKGSILCFSLFFLVWCQREWIFLIWCPTYLLFRPCIFKWQPIRKKLSYTEGKELLFFFFNIEDHLLGWKPRKR